MSNLKDAIKSLTTEGTKKRYWPSKNPIDDPQDFPGEQNFEEENEDTEPFRDHEYNAFNKKDLIAAILPHFVHDDDEDRSDESKFLSQLEYFLSSVKNPITRPVFQKILKRANVPGVDSNEILKKVLKGAEELYADNVGPYGSMRGEEEDEYGRDQGAMHDVEPEDDDDKVYQTTQCASCGGDGCDLCDYSGDFGQWVSTGEENEEHGEDEKPEWSKNSELMPSVSKLNKKEAAFRHAGRMQQSGDKYWSVGSNQNNEENEERDVSRFDYVNIIPEKNGKFTVKGYDSFPAHSVLAGQVRKNFLASFNSAEEAQAAYPMAKMSHHMMEPENHFGHLSDEEGEEERSDCNLCGNTGYSMADGKVCPLCDEGKHEAEAHAAGRRIPAGSEENEEVKIPTTKYAKTLRQWMKTK